jgi:hypothetical protein
MRVVFFRNGATGFTHSVYSYIHLFRNLFDISIPRDEDMTLSRIVGH